MGHVFWIVRLTCAWSQKGKFDSLGYDCKGLGCCGSVRSGSGVNFPEPWTGPTVQFRKIPEPEPEPTQTQTRLKEHDLKKKNIWVWVHRGSQTTNPNPKSRCGKGCVEVQTISSNWCQRVCLIHHEPKKCAGRCVDLLSTYSICTQYVTGSSSSTGFITIWRETRPCNPEQIIEECTYCKGPPHLWLTRLLSALLSSKKHGRHHHKGRHHLSLYQSLRRTQPHPDTPTAQSSPYPRGQGNPLHR